MYKDLLQLRNLLRIASRAIGFVLVFSFIFNAVVKAESMQSDNYRIQSDSLNFGGSRSASESYSAEDTLGESATGDSSSENFAMKAGYQQVDSNFISVTPASNVTMSPSIGSVTGGTANGNTSFTVLTDSPAGYEAYISASSSPALATAEDSFADYSRGANPDFAFSVSDSDSVFAFSPEGDDIASDYKDDGASCGSGVLDTANACWDGLSTSDKLIVKRTSANQPSGTETVLKFRAASGTGHVQIVGEYTATTTITVLAL